MLFDREVTWMCSVTSSGNFSTLRLERTYKHIMLTPESVSVSHKILYDSMKCITVLVMEHICARKMQRHSHTFMIVSYGCVFSVVLTGITRRKATALQDAIGSVGTSGPQKTPPTRCRVSNTGDPGLPLYTRPQTSYPLGQEAYNRNIIGVGTGIPS